MSNARFAMISMKVSGGRARQSVAMSETLTISTLAKRSRIRSGPRWIETGAGRPRARSSACSTTACDEDVVGMERAADEGGAFEVALDARVRLQDRLPDDL